MRTIPAMKNITDLNASGKGAHRAEGFQVRKQPYCKGKAKDCFATVTEAQEHRDPIYKSLDLLKEHRAIFGDGPDYKSPMSSRDFLLLSEPALKGKICDMVLAVLNPLGVAELTAANKSDVPTIREMIEWDVERKIIAERVIAQNLKPELQYTPAKWAAYWAAEDGHGKKKNATSWEKNGHCSKLRWLANSPLGDCAIDTVTPEMIENVRDSAKTTPGSRNMMVKYLGGAWTRFTTAKRLRQHLNQVAGVNKLDEPEAVKIEGFTHPEALNVIKKLNKEGKTGDFPLVPQCCEIAALTTTRRSDILNLRLSNVMDLHGDDPHLSFYSMKVRRTVTPALLPRAVEVIEELIARAEEMAGKKRKNLPVHTNLFTKENGNALPLAARDHNAAFERVYIPMLKKMGLWKPTKNMHRWRSYGATELYLAGWDKAAMGEQMGVDGETAMGYVDAHIKKQQRKANVAKSAALAAKRKKPHLKAVS